MSAPTHLIIGLGNPGDEYARTRHNVGFRVVDEIALRYNCAPWKKKFRSLITGANKFLLQKPQTYMNLSGEAAIEALNFYQLPPEHVVVFHDDLDLLCGQIKIKQGGGAGGHNGLKSLDTHIGQNYWRVRIGIGRPMTEQGERVKGAVAVARSAEQSRQLKGDVVSNYVLNPFAKADQLWLEPLVTALAGEFDLMLAGNPAAYAKAGAKNPG